MKNKALFFMIILLFHFSNSYSIYEVSFKYPKAGDTLYIGDTVQFKFAMDPSFFKKDAHSFQMILEIKEDTSKLWAMIFSLEYPDDGISTFDSQVVRNPKFFIPDSVKTLPTRPFTKLSGKKCLLRYREYSATEYKVGDTTDSSILFMYRPAPVIQNSSESKDTGCGKGSLVALLIPVGLRIFKRKKIGCK